MAPHSLFVVEKASLCLTLGVRICKVGRRNRKRPGHPSVIPLHEHGCFLLLFARQMKVMKTTLNYNQKLLWRTMKRGAETEPWSQHRLQIKHRSTTGTYCWSTSSVFWCGSPRWRPASSILAVQSGASTEQTPPYICVSFRYDLTKGPPWACRTNYMHK